MQVVIVITHKIEGLGHRQIYLIKSLADEEDASLTRGTCLIDSSARGWAIDVSTASPRGIEGDARSLGNLVDQLNDITGSERGRAHRLADRIIRDVATLLLLLARFGRSDEAMMSWRAFTGRSLDGTAPNPSEQLQPVGAEKVAEGETK